MSHFSNTRLYTRDRYHDSMERNSQFSKICPYQTTYNSSYANKTYGSPYLRENYSQRSDFYSLDRNLSHRTANRSLSRDTSLNRISYAGVSTDSHTDSSIRSPNRALPRDTSLPRITNTDTRRPYDSVSRDLDRLTITRNNNHYYPPGEIGLDNLGNTCFMNSIIQCLSHTQPLLSYLRSKKYKEESPNGYNKTEKVLEELGDIFDELWDTTSLKSSVKPAHFKSLIEKASGHFSGYEQQDAQEFLLFLLEILHQEVNKCRGAKNGFNMDELDKLNDQEKAQRTWELYVKLDDSFFVDKFVGLLKTTLKCQKCAKSSSKFEPFWDLSLPLPKGRNTFDLKDCFNLFTSEELLSGEEQPLCSYCKQKTECSMRVSLHRLPKILVLHLKRFSIGHIRSKVSNFVHFPHKLDIRSYVDSSIDSSPSGHYQLYAVTNHVGTPYAGHYTAHCKNPDTGKWHTFSDESVRSVQEASVISSDAYILFYEWISR